MTPPKQPHTVEVPVAWLKKLLELNDLVIDYSGSNMRLAHLKGYIESAEALIGDSND